MKTKTIFYILVFSAYGVLIIGGLVQGFTYNWNKDLLQQHSINDNGNLIMQIGLLIMGIFVGFTIFTPRGKKEYTRYDFIKPKGE